MEQMTSRKQEIQPERLGLTKKPKTVGPKGWNPQYTGKKDILGGVVLLRT